jgi:threonine dehydratase
MKFMGERCKMVVEPTGVLGLVGLENLIKEGSIKDGARVGIILTGGNVDL